MLKNVKKVAIGLLMGISLCMNTTYAYDPDVDVMQAMTDEVRDGNQGDFTDGKWEKVVFPDMVIMGYKDTVVQVTHQKWGYQYDGAVIGNKIGSTVMSTDLTSSTYNKYDKMDHYVYTYADGTKCRLDVTSKGIIVRIVRFGLIDG